MIRWEDFVGKKWPEMSNEMKVAEMALTGAENVKLGYWDTERLKTYIAESIDAIYKAKTPETELRERGFVRS